MEIRELRAEEIPAEAGVPVGSLVMGVVEDDQVVALLGAFSMVFLDPLWVAPQRRGMIGPVLMRSLWDRMRVRLSGLGINIAVGHADQSHPVMSNLLKRIGGQEVLGKRQFVVRLEER